MKTGEMRHEFAGGEEVRQDHAASVDKSRARAHLLTAPTPPTPPGQAALQGLGLISHAFATHSL